MWVFFNATCTKGAPAVCCASTLSLHRSAASRADDKPRVEANLAAKAPQLQRPARADNTDKAVV
jgi:hypothetical protein